MWQRPEPIRSVLLGIRRYLGKGRVKLPEEDFADIIGGYEGGVVIEHSLDAVEMQGGLLHVSIHNLELLVDT